jgi:ABC-type uncharacterized transport system substrate-binding protein
MCQNCVRTPGTAPPPGPGKPRQSRHRFNRDGATAKWGSYGEEVRAMYQHAATHVDKILKGAKPADLPVAQSTKVRLVINLKTAAARGVTIPPAVLLRADHVIE